MNIKRMELREPRTAFLLADFVCLVTDDAGNASIHPCILWSSAVTDVRSTEDMDSRSAATA